MSVWYEGSDEIEVGLDDVKADLEDHGEHYVGVIRLMPGMTSVELVEQGSDSVIIRTNEGLMTRSNISKLIEADRVVVRYDEEYQAGSKVTATSHFRDEFTATDTGVLYHLVMSDVESSGFLGSLYRKFGSARMGNAFLTAYKAYFEK